MNKDINIVIAYDHSVVRHGLALLLKKAFVNVVITHADTFERLLFELKLSRPNF